MNDFVFQQSGGPIADGRYSATFKGVEKAEAREWQGKMLEEGRRWSFAITNGPPGVAGRTVQRITQAKPTDKNACGKMIVGLLGRVPQVGESVGTAIAGCVGKAYHVVVSKGTIDR